MREGKLSTNRFFRALFLRLVLLTDLEIQKTPSPLSQGRSMAVPWWLASPVGVTKVNVDVALSKNDKLAALSAIARDEAGVFMGASPIVIQGADHPESLEAAACREALALARDLNIRRVKLASECANIIRSIATGAVLGSYGQMTSVF